MNSPKATKKSSPISGVTLANRHTAVMMMTRRRRRMTMTATSLCVTTPTDRGSNIPHVLHTTGDFL